MATATGTDVKNLQGVPEILELETKEEQRVQKKLQSFVEAEAETARKLEEERKAAETAARDEAKKELEAYKKEELVKILSQGEDARDAELKSIDASFKKKSAALVASLAERVSDPAFLS